MKHRRTLLVILMALLSLALSANVTQKLWASSQLPHARSEIRIEGSISTRTSTSKDPKMSLVLDGTLTGYNLNKVQHVLGKPCAQWFYPFLLAGWQENEWSTARWIIYRESRCLQYAFNGHDAGLMQINQIHRQRVDSYGLRFPEDLLDGETNLWVAYMMWLDHGWQPWEFKGIVPGGK